MKVLLSVLLLIPVIAIGQVVNPPGGGGPPTGTAGGDLSGTYPNPTVSASHITSGAAAFTGTSSVTSTADSSSTATFTINDTGPAAATMIGQAVYAPNMIAGNSLYYILGKGISSGSSYWMKYTQGSGPTTTYLTFLPASLSPQLVLFTSGNSVFGNTTTDNGFKLDILGTSRSTTHTLTTAATAAGQIGYDSTGNRFSAFTGGLVGTPQRTIFTLLANTPTITATVTPSSILNGAATVQGTTTLPSGYITAARKFRVGISGVFSLVSTDTMTVSFSIGGTTVTSTPAMNLGSTVTNGEYNVDLQVTCRSVVANVATCVVRGWTQADTATSGQREVYSMFNGGNTFTVPTNAANLLDVTLAFSSASASDSATSFSAGVYEIN